MTCTQTRRVWDVTSVLSASERTTSVSSSFVPAGAHVTAAVLQRRDRGVAGERRIGGPVAVAVEPVLDRGRGGQALADQRRAGVDVDVRVARRLAVDAGLRDDPEAARLLLDGAGLVDEQPAATRSRVALVALGTGNALRAARAGRDLTRRDVGGAQATVADVAPLSDRCGRLARSASRCGRRAR